MVITYREHAAWKNLPSAVVYIVVIISEGDKNIGSGFHVGGG